MAKRERDTYVVGRDDVKALVTLLECMCLGYSDTARRATSVIADMAKWLEATPEEVHDGSGQGLESQGELRVHQGG